MEIKFYEIELGIKEDGAQTGNYESPCSICIKADYWPSIKEAEELLIEDMKTFGYDCVHSITPIEEYEVHQFFDDSNIDDWPILRKESPMKVKDLICNKYFDVNCNYAIYIGIWNDGGECVWSTKNNGYGELPIELLTKEIRYMTVNNNVLIIEIN